MPFDECLSNNVTNELTSRLARHFCFCFHKEANALLGLQIMFVGSSKHQRAQIEHMCFIIYYRICAALHEQPSSLPGHILYLRLLEPADLLGTPEPPVRRNGVGKGASSSLLLLLS
jgi:hypothetical protein